MKIPIHQIDAFAEAPFQGNPAAVCPLGEWLPDATLQAIAAENNLAETAFYVLENEGYRIRWFTPVAEVDLCGHATLATAHVMFQTTHQDARQISFQSRSGLLSVTREKNGLLTLNFPAQPGVACAVPELLCQALGATPSECFAAADYMAVFEDEETIARMEPDFRLLRELDLRGVMVTAKGAETDYVSRFFAPKLGLDEDPATGSSHCVLTPYWAERLGRTELSARQLSKRIGDFRCQLAGDRVLISGRTIPYLEGVIEI